MKINFMVTATTKIANLLQSNPDLTSQLKKINKKNTLIVFLSKEAKLRKVSLSKKEITEVIDHGVKGIYHSVPTQKVFGATCFNGSSDSDEENGGTSSVPSC